MDFSKAAMLLHVCAKSKDWPNLKVLHDAAMGELEAMCKPKEDPKPKAVPNKPADVRVSGQGQTAHGSPVAGGPTTALVERREL